MYKKILDSTIEIAIILWVVLFFLVVIKNLFNPIITGPIIALSVAVIAFLLWNTQEKSKLLSRQNG
jgi:hypothetical protein